MKILDYLRIYYNRTGYKILVIFALILGESALEAVGVSMLAPILSAGSDIAGTSGLTAYIHQIFQFFGIEPTLTILLVFLVITFIFKAGFSSVLMAYSIYVKIQIRRKLQKELVLSYSKLNYDVHQKQTSGHVNNIIVKEVPRFLHSFIEFTRLPVGIIQAGIYLSLAMMIDWVSALALLCIGAISFLLIQPLVRLSRSLSLNVSRTYGDLQGTIIEYIQNILYLRATANVAQLSDRVEGAVDRLGDHEWKLAIISTFVKVISEPIAITFLAAVLYFNVVVDGQKITDVLILSFMLYRLLTRILAVQGGWQKFNSAVGGLETVENALKLFETNQESNGTEKFSRSSSQIQFSKVDLVYGNQKILDNISLTIPENKSIGIVGPSGAGKTSFFNLVTGLVDPTQGTITVGDQDFKTLEKDSFRKAIGFVPQDPVILNDTLLNNVVLGRLDCQKLETIERVKQAMKDAGCENLIPKFHEILGERGIRLSGGERQRLAIAREILMKPQFLILDEATSALDSYSEEIVQNSLKALKDECTIMLIAHRLSTVVNCDKIYVFKAGKVVAEGTFKDLYSQEDSFFRSMCDKQGVQP